MPTRIRWLVALAICLVCVALGRSLIGGPGASPDTVHTLTLFNIALAIYAWILYPPAGSLVITLVVLLCLVWAWAVRQTTTLGWELAAFGVLLGVVTWQQRLRSRRLVRMQQKLDDLREEQTVKDQAVALASQASQALHKKLSRYMQLQAIAEELSNLTDLTAIATLAVERAFALIGKSDVCCLFLVDPERQELSLFASKRREALPSIRAKHGDQFDRHVLRTHQPLLVNDARRDFRFTVGVVRDREISSVIACPLIVGQSPAGVLRLDSSRAGLYTQDDLRFLDILLDLVGTAVTNARLFAQTQQLAITDGLTGLTLRRPFLEQLTLELTRAGRSREPVSMLMLDVDHFKAYNDTFGHTAGDLILKGVAGVLRAVVPPGGMIGRYGGEEFVVLLPRLSRHQAGDVAEQIRRTVEQQLQGEHRSPARRDGLPGQARPAPIPGEPRRPVSVSLGVASCPDDAKAELELIRVADQRLYQAKHAGRNCVISS